MIKSTSKSMTTDLGDTQLGITEEWLRSLGAVDTEFHAGHGVRFDLDHTSVYVLWLAARPNEACVSIGTSAISGPWNRERFSSLLTSLGYHLNEPKSE
jgi:hypothetical protein